MKDIPFDLTKIPEFTTDEQMLRFLIDFAQQDLAQFRRGDWLNLYDTLRKHFPEEATTEKELESSRLAAIQKDLLGLFREYVSLREATEYELREPGLAVHFWGTSSEKSLPLSATARLSVGYGGTGVYPLLSSPHLRDHVLFTIGVILARLDPDYLRACPVCDRLFYAEHGRQVFHDAKCKNKATWQAYQQRTHSEKEESSSQKETTKTAATDNRKHRTTQEEK